MQNFYKKKGVLCTPFPYCYFAPSDFQAVALIPPFPLLRWAGLYFLNCLNFMSAKESLLLKLLFPRPHLSAQYFY